HHLLFEYAATGWGPGFYELKLNVIEPLGVRLATAHANAEEIRFDRTTHRFNIHFKHATTGEHPWQRNLHVPQADWVLKGAADVDGDGNADLLWQHQQTGKVISWNLSAWANIKSMNVLARSTPWQLQEVADRDADGDADLLFFN